MSEHREEISALIASIRVKIWGANESELCGHDYEIADAVLAAGWTKPRAVTTVEELDALPEWAVIIDESKDTCVKRAYGWLSSEDAETYKAKSIPLPATVLWEPTPGADQ